MIRTSLRKLTQRGQTLPARDARHTLKDRALVLRLIQIFERDMALAELHGIHFYVRDAKVTLYGTIRHELDRDLIVSLVRQIPGVKDVAPHLQIADRPALDSDATLTLSL